MIKQVLFYLILVPFGYWVIKRLLGREYLGKFVSAINWRDLFFLGFLSAVASFALFYFPARYLIDYGFSQHVAVGIGVLLIFVAIVVTIILDYHEARKNEQVDLIGIINLTIATLMLGVNIFSAVSLGLYKNGIAVYTSATEIDYGRFVELYMWQFLDVLPFVRLAETLTLKSPMSIDNFWAGLPVLSFKLFVILQIIKSIKDWLAWRSEKKKKRESAAAG